MTRLSPMGIGEILDTALRIYKERLRSFIAIAVVIAVPLSFTSALFAGALRAVKPKPGPDYDDLFNVVLAPAAHRHHAAGFAVLGGNLPTFDIESAGMALFAMIASFALIVIGVLTVFSMAYPLCMGALVVSTSASYLGEPVGAGESYLRAFRKLWRLLIAQGWTTIVVLLGLMLCVLPGLVLWVQLLLVPEVVILEDLKVFPAMSRSRALMSDYLGKAVILTLVVALFGAVVDEAISVVVHAIPWPYAIIGDFLSSFMLQLVMLPLSIATTVVFYYDLRIRKEGFDLQRLANGMAEPGAPIRGAAGFPAT